MPVTPRLRSACDACHQLKVRCSGYLPCNSCTDSHRTCVFSMSNRLGRPLGSKNKRVVTPASGTENTPLSASQKSFLANPGPREVRKKRNRCNTHLEDRLDLSPSPIAPPQSVSEPASVSSDDMSSPKSSGPSSFTDVHSTSWTTSPFDYSLPFVEDKWEPQESFVPQNLARSPFQREEIFERQHESVFHDISIGQSELTLLFETESTEMLAPLGVNEGLLMNGADAALESLTNRLAMQIEKFRELQARWQCVIEKCLVQHASSSEGLLQSVNWVCGESQNAPPNVSWRNSPGTSQEKHLEAVRVLIGDFEVIDSDKSILLSMFWSMTLQKVEKVLESLGGVLGRKKDASGHLTDQGALLASDLSVVEHTIEGLSHLTRSLRVDPQKGKSPWWPV
ncbi:hypothetical protein V8C37DRAFT_409516 [Trichoderma ceciliae]